MANLIYIANTSLDGYTEDKDSTFDWTDPREVIPILVAGGKSALPDNVRLELELLGERRFHNGIVFLRYRPRQGRAT